MPVLRNVDVFVKARADIRTETQSASGGLITLIAATTAFLLFVGQIYFFVFPTQTHTLHLSESTQFPMFAHDAVDPFQQRLYDIKGKIPLYFKITFLHLSCESVEVKFNNEVVRGDAFSGYSRPGGGKKKPNANSNSNNNNNNKKLTIKKYKPKSADHRKIFGSEHSTEAHKHTGKGCTLVGNMRVPIVAGTLAITMTRNAWTEALNYLMVKSRFGGGAAQHNADFDSHKNDFNMTHFIHEVRFGKQGSAAMKGLTTTYVPPLENKLHTIVNEMNGIALESIQVKLIPTVHSNPGLFSQLFGNGNRPFYQMSVVDHTIQPETMVAQGGGGGGNSPGISLGYDVMPLAVHINEMNTGSAGVGDESFFMFLSTLIGIVGGCFVTVGLFAGCAVKSVQAVAKKMD